MKLLKKLFKQKKAKNTSPLPYRRIKKGCKIKKLKTNGLDRH